MRAAAARRNHARRLQKTRARTARLVQEDLVEAAAIDLCTGLAGRMRQDIGAPRPMDDRGFRPAAARRLQAVARADLVENWHRRGRQRDPDMPARKSLAFGDADVAAEAGEP